MKKIITLLISIAISFSSFGQGQANIWHFGHNAGIDFNSGTAVAISGPVNSSEGCAVISDDSGNLLFSLNGYWAFDNTGNQMNLWALEGDVSSTQTALIVPFPGNNNEYYIFTTPITSFAGSSTGFNYSVIDMTLNGGLGGFVSLNTNLLSSSCEKLTGVRNTNGTDYWVIMHAYPTNEFYVYPVTASGIGTPIISAIGPTINNSTETHGYLKCSPNGLKLAAAKLGTAIAPIELYDFNPSTGVISNYDSIPSAYNDYGLSFSPDNSKLYVNSGYGGPAITQYDLTISNFQNFPYTVFPSVVNYGALQLAPDGKIYFANNGENNLGVINNPNLVGAACNFVDSGFILLSGTTSTLGLPNFIDSYFAIICNPIPPTNLSQTICLGDSYFFNGTNISAPGNYSATLSAVNGCDSVVNLILAVDIIDTTIQILNNTMTVTGSGDVQWFNCNTQQIIAGATGNVFVATISGNYAAIITEGNCTDTTACYNVVTGINELLIGGLNSTVTPNPCTTCEITGATNATDLTVTDILGRKQNASFSKSANGYYINLPEASTGIFIIRNIKTGEVVKFVRE